MGKTNTENCTKLRMDILSSIGEYPGKLNIQEDIPKVFYPRNDIKKNAYVKSMEEYERLYQESIKNPEKFWKQMASEFYFVEEEDGNNNTNGFNYSYNFDPKIGPVYTNFMKGMKTNVCYNVLDRHLKKIGGKTAFYWEGNDPGDSDSVTYSELYLQVCILANALKSLGVQKGDIVVISLPNVIETVVVMLACLRIGAVHSLVFAGYSAQSLSDRLVEGKVKILITVDGFWRGEKFVAQKEICDDAILKSHEKGHIVEHCVVLNHLARLQRTENISGLAISKKASYVTPFQSGRDKWWHEICDGMSTECTPEWVDCEHPMFILYTSGSTGNPKGIVHTTGGYLIFASTNFKFSFDFHGDRDDVMWGTPDLGWCAGHTNVVYGPLSVGGTSVLFDGSPFHPSVKRPWEIIQKYRVTHFYTSPTLLRHLMKFGDGPCQQGNRGTLRVLGTVGEPISPKVWLWYYRVVGNSRCPIVDTYGQTETGGHVLTSLPGAMPMKPGAVGFPFFGVVPVLLSKEGEIIEGVGEGCLVFSQPWPSIVRTLHGDQRKYSDKYFSQFPGYYTTGDAARRDADGHYWMCGRVDDMLKVSGRLISVTKVESAILEHPAVAEVAVVPVPDEIKGQCIHSFVVLKQNFKSSENIVSEIKLKVSQSLGSFARPDAIWITPALPTTRSGKVLRRVLPLVATGNTDLGDISCLADTSVLQTLANIVKNNKTNCDL